MFDPAARLLRTAPWVATRGNHEECSRAGQGWYRLLDTGAFDASRSCDDPAADVVADFSEPYAVPLGNGWQLVIFDSAVAGNNPLRPNDLRDARVLARYQAEIATVGHLTATTSIMICRWLSRRTQARLPVSASLRSPIPAFLATS